MATFNQLTSGEFEYQSSASTITDDHYVIGYNGATGPGSERKYKLSDLKMHLNRDPVVAGQGAVNNEGGQITFKSSWNGQNISINSWKIDIYSRDPAPDLNADNDKGDWFRFFLNGNTSQCFAPNGLTHLGGTWPDVTSMDSSQQASLNVHSRFTELLGSNSSTNEWKCGSASKKRVTWVGSGGRPSVYTGERIAIVPKGKSEHGRGKYYSYSAEVAGVDGNDIILVDDWKSSELTSGQNVNVYRESSLLNLFTCNTSKGSQAGWKFRAGGVMSVKENLKITSDTHGDIFDFVEYSDNRRYLMRGKDKKPTLLQVGGSLDGSQGGGFVEVLQDQSGAHGVTGSGFGYIADATPSWACIVPAIDNLNNTQHDLGVIYRKHNEVRHPMLWWRYNNDTLYTSGNMWIDRGNGVVYADKIDLSTSTSDTSTVGRSTNSYAWIKRSGGGLDFGSDDPIRFMETDQDKVIGRISTNQGKFRFGSDDTSLGSNTNTKPTLQVSGGTTPGAWIENGGLKIGPWKENEDMAGWGSGNAIGIWQNNTGNSVASINLNGPSNVEKSIIWSDGSAKKWWFGRDNSGNINKGLGFYSYVSSGGEGFKLTLRDDTGYVGINKSNPAYQLDVHGDIRATGNIITQSDVRYKTQIHDVTDSINKIMRLRGVKYNKTNSDRSHYGVVAQEVENVLPELVYTHKSDMFDDEKSVDYMSLIPVLIQAVKEQQQQIESLQQRVDQ